MPLQHYGVVVGDVVGFHRDPPDAYGRWYHGHLEVSTPGGPWTSALDVDTPTGLGIRYRTSRGLATSVLGPVAQLAPGFHLLPSTPSSGAIDYIRSTFLKDVFLWVRTAARLGWPSAPVPIPVLPPGTEAVPPTRPPLPDSLKEFLLRWLERFDRIVPVRIPIHLRPWIKSDGDNALSSLEAHVAPGRRAYLFGERFTTGQGVHDVHQNQGDPAGSQWYASNGTWQDGAVGVVEPDGTLFFWQVRFESQATATDSAGHPL